MDDPYAFDVASFKRRNNGNDQIGDVDEIYHNASFEQIFNLWGPNLCDLLRPPKMGGAVSYLGTH
jgi:hypothetical protein